MNDNYIKDPSRDFVAIDVEYADSAQNICQFGLAVVRNLQIVEKRSWLIQPPGNYYEERCVKVHHITPSVTLYSPTFPQAWPEIEPYLSGYQLWAHNAGSVEESVLEKNLTLHRIVHQHYSFFDSRQLYQRPDCDENKGNGIKQCCMALGMPCEGHHDAEEDARMCAELVIAYQLGKLPCWDGVPFTDEEIRKSKQEKHILRMGEFCEYYASNSSGEEDVLAEISSTCDGAVPQLIDVFDKGDHTSEGKTSSVDFSRLHTGENNPLYGKKVVLTGMFHIDRKQIEQALEQMGAKKVAKPARNTDAVIMGTRNVGFTKLIALEEQESNGHHIARIVGNEDLETLLYGEGKKFFV